MRDITLLNAWIKLYVVDWGISTMSFGKSATWRESLDFSFEGSIDPEHHDSAMDIIQRVLGDTIDKTVQEVVQEFIPVKK